MKQQQCLEFGCSLCYSSHGIYTDAVGEETMKQWFIKHSIGLSLVLVLAVMGMIFCFSAQTGESSGALSGRITARVVRFCVPDFDAFSETQQKALLSTVGLLIRKAAHFSEFALLGFSLMLHIQQLRKRIHVPTSWLWAWAVGTAYAISDELHQHFVGGRYPAAMDVLIDSCGVIAGILLLVLILRHRQFSNIKREKCQMLPKKP